MPIGNLTGMSEEERAVIDSWYQTLEPRSDDKDYPRDMRGYGDNTPDAGWPGGARIAVQFVINYEEGAENCVLHGDAASEAFLSEIVGAQPLLKPAPHEHGVAFTSTALGPVSGDCTDCSQSADMPVTVFGVAMALQRNPRGGCCHAGRQTGKSRVMVIAG